MINDKSGKTLTFLILFMTGAHLEDAPVHRHPGDVSGPPLGCQVYPSRSRLSLCPHHDDTSQEVPAAQNLQSERASSSRPNWRPESR